MMRAIFAFFAMSLSLRKGRFLFTIHSLCGARCTP